MEIGGYASIFGEVDLGKDRVAPGAFAASLAGRAPSTIRMLYHHNPTQPIGVWTSVVEDGKGLRVRGRISPGTTRGDEILKLLRDGAIDGLSIGFKTRVSTRDFSSGVRTILEADLWEISVVPFPMLPSARIQAHFIAQKE